MVARRPCTFFSYVSAELGAGGGVGGVGAAQGLVAEKRRGIRRDPLISNHKSSQTTHDSASIRPLLLRRTQVPLPTLPLPLPLLFAVGRLLVQQTQSAT